MAHGLCCSEACGNLPRRGIEPVSPLPHWTTREVLLCSILSPCSLQTSCVVSRRMSSLRTGLMAGSSHLSPRARMVLVQSIEFHWIKRCVGEWLCHVKKRTGGQWPLLTTQNGNSCRKLIAKPVTNGVPDKLSHAMRRTPSYSQGGVQSWIKGPRWSPSLRKYWSSAGPERGGWLWHRTVLPSC